MYELEIRRSFSAAHQLRGYNGLCKNLHGHNYGVVAVVRSGTLNEIGIALDFRTLKKALDSILEDYDHHNLSELPEFQKLNASSELIAKTIFMRLKAALKEENAVVHSVRIEESENSACTYFEEEQNG